MNNTIWLYWEGGQVPDYYALCRESIQRHNANVALVGPEDLPELIGPLPDILRRCYVTYRVDWIRKMLLWRQGGMYIDSDFICLKPLDGFLAMAPHFDYVGYSEWDGGHMDNFMCARAGSPFLKCAADYALQVMEKKLGKIGWLEASRNAINHAFSELKWKCEWMLIPTHLISPVAVTEPAWFKASPDEGECSPRHFSYGYMTSVHSLGAWLDGKSKEDLLRGDARLCHLLRKAHNVSAEQVSSVRG